LEKTSVGGITFGHIGATREDVTAVWGMTGTRDGGVVISGYTSGANGRDILIVKLDVP